MQGDDIIALTCQCQSCILTVDPKSFGLDVDNTISILTQCMKNQQYIKTLWYIVDFSFTLCFTQKWTGKKLASVTEDCGMQYRNITITSVTKGEKVFQFQYSVVFKPIGSGTISITGFFYQLPTKDCLITVVWITIVTWALHLSLHSITWYIGLCFHIRALHKFIFRWQDLFYANANAFCSVDTIDFTSVPVPA